MESNDTIMSARWSDGQLNLMAAKAHAALRADGIPYKAITCSDCPSRYKCQLAFDTYNTDGDCLADK